jgi:uncharacterized protein
VRGLIVPGLNGSGSAHWQTLWERQYDFERVEQRDWRNPDAEAWTAALDKAIRVHSDPVVLIAHSMGCWTVMRWAAVHPDSRDRVRSSLLVAPPDIAASDALPKSARGFLHHQTIKLPFPSILVGSENDPYMSIDRAQLLARTIGSRFVNAGTAGHINIESGHGHWPEGEVLLHKILHCPDGEPLRETCSSAQKKLIIFCKLL